ncbi:homeobox-leucine zipper protein GLABRA 2 isoform X2 [Asparagus officinalis]|nr:homeobox-leucine zipper protein GLABRA 2 isoform X2 [Asparagus officinalis]
MVEISSENTGPLGQSDENLDVEGQEEEDDEDAGDNCKRKKRKKYHRHTAQQIREMEALFKESPHPDEKQRQQLSKKLGLSPRQVKFWFQNRRTQIKAMQERHENSLLKSEMDKLREENHHMREAMKKVSCPNCGFNTVSNDSAITTEEQQLRIENARLRAEIEKLQGKSGNLPEGTASLSSSWTVGTDQNNRATIKGYAGYLGLEKSKIMQIVDLALDELIKMATTHEPLWIRSIETNREILNYDEYRKAFVSEATSNGSQNKLSVEASRETGMVFLGISKLVQAFMDVNQWKKVFPCMISKASTVDVISEGESETRSGLLQLMFSELQMLTPVVPTRELYFVRQCKQLSDNRWAILDVSIDKIEESIDVNLVKFRKRPSGCIIEEKANGHCKVIWVEHMEYKKNVIPTMYRSIVNSGLAFGAWHWIMTLQLQCERMMFFMATNVPAKESIGVSTLAGRRSILTLAERMCISFCHAMGGSRNRAWTRVSTKSGDDISFTSRKNISDPGEPLGLIVSAVSSTWLPVASPVLFEFLRDESRRTEWDIILSRGPAETIVNLVKGKDRGNSITVHATKSTERNCMWILQDSCTNAYESMIVYAPVDSNGMQKVLTGCDSSDMAILPSGFSILPDGIDSRPVVITSRPEERSTEGGSLLTVAFQILASASPSAKVTMEIVENVNTLVSCTLQNIKRSLHCDDG